MAIRIAPTSGSTTSPSPVSTIRSMPADRVRAEHQLVQLGGHPLGGDALELAAPSPPSPPRTRGATVKPELRDEPRRPQHPQRIVAERHLRRGGRVEHAGAQRRQTAQRIEEFAGTVGA